MNRLIATIKRIRVRQFFTVFLAGILMLVSTACTSPDLPTNKVSQNLQNSGDVGKDKLNEMGKKVNETKETLDHKTKEFTENSKQEMEKIKENAGNRVEGVKDMAKDASGEAKKKIDDTNDTIKSKVTQSMENMKRAVDKVIN